MGVLRRGVSSSPELRAGLAFTVAMALASAAGKLAIPILIQQILAPGRRRRRATSTCRLVAGACLATVVIIGVVAVISRVTYIRLVTAAEAMLYSLRTQAFAHIHPLSIADHNEADAAS